MGHIFNLYKRFGGASLLREYLTTGFLFKAPLQLLATGLSDKGLELFARQHRSPPTDTWKSTMQNTCLQPTTVPRLCSAAAGKYGYSGGKAWTEHPGW